jgi:3-oxoacyl-[acyl-carrier-protein] synthase II
MVGTNDIVITGLGCVSPIGIGRQAFWHGLQSGHCGIRPLLNVSQNAGAVEAPHIYYGGVIDGFDGKVYVTPRKALKVMNREVQTAYSAAHLAWQDAGLTQCEIEPQRLGVIYGAEMLPGEIKDISPAIVNCTADGQMHYERWGTQFGKDIFPLWMLKNLPNMPACHVGIAINAQGPNNTIVQEETSGLLALIEACMIMDRDQTDVMLVGAVGGRVGPARLAFRHPDLYRTCDIPTDGPLDGRGVCIPFDKQRAGIVPGEGAAAVVLERRSHAVKRQAKIFGEVVGFANRFAKPADYCGGSHVAVANAVSAALAMADIQPEQLAVVAAQGYSSPKLDIQESRGIESQCGQVPVTAFSSYFGTAGAGSALIELLGGLLATSHGLVLPTLGVKQLDPECPVNVMTKTAGTDRDYMLKLSLTPYGHAVAVVIRCNRLIS